MRIRPSHFFLSFTFVIALVYLPFWQNDGSRKKETDQERGKKLYEKYACTSCHGPKGVLMGDLRKAYIKYSDEQLTNYIKNPRAFGNVKMPVFGGVIDEAEYKYLITYVKFLGREANKAK